MGTSHHPLATAHRGASAHAALGRMGSSDLALRLLACHTWARLRTAALCLRRCGMLGAVAAQVLASMF